jgi:site-specific DNA-methyltransferase (adenine-specific)
MPTREIILGDNAEVLPTLPAAFAELIYVDPPFNSGRTQVRKRLRVTADASASRRGFGGRAYQVEQVSESRYEDSFDDYTGFLLPRLQAALRCLTPDGSLFVHLDAREVHYVKVALDTMLGRDAFMNEIIWAYDFGGRPKTRWPAKHDSILWYAKNPKAYVFDYDAIDRIPYLAPGLVGPEKAARGKTPTDVWWQTIVPTNGREKTGYATQKPLAVLERIVRVHTRPGATVLDFFAGSGTTGEAAARHGRGFVLVDQSRDAVRVMAKRLASFDPKLVGFEPAGESSSDAARPARAATPRVPRRAR